jgi:two-component system alkaline phosphatase synthesis response regulator PhoP
MERILVVDDDKDIVRLVRSYLENAGYVVLSAYDGETALHTLRREKPDLLVLDLMLPDRDGWDITRIIRGDAHLAGLPIIMLTARVEDSDKIVGLEIGADDYITKPFNPREVVARVRALLRRSSLARDPIASQIFQVGAGYVFTRDELMDKALGYGFEGMGRTLDSHIKNLRRKIEIDPGYTAYIQTVYGVGYRLEENDQ